MTDLPIPNQATGTVAAQPAFAVANYSGPSRPAADDMRDGVAPALAYREAGDYAKAESWLTDRLVAQPGDALALAHLAHIQMLRKRDAAAHATLVRAEAIAPDDPLILRNRARLALRAQRIDIAASAAARALAADPADPENRLVQAVVLGVQGEAERALQALDALLAERPEYAEALANRALLHIRARNTAAAIADAQRALEIKPHLPQPWRLLAGIHAQAMRTEDAVLALRRYCELEPEDAVALADFGVLLRQRGLTEEALTVLSRAVEIAPKLVAAWVNYGITLQQAKRSGDAAIAYEKALALEPDLAEVHNNLGMALKEQGKLDEAVARYQQALARKPDFAEAHINLGYAFTEQGRLDEAVAQYQRALVLKPDLAEAHNNLGIALVEQGKLDEAVACYRQALVLKPDLAEAHNNLGLVLKEQGKLDEAVAYYRRALVLKPDYPEPYGNIGAALRDLGRIKEAENAVRKALQLDPAKPGLYLDLGKVKRFVGGDVDLTRMEMLAQNISELRVKERIELHFSLGKAYADIGKHDFSFQHLVQGNALKRQQINYNESVTLDYFKRIQEIFTFDLVRRSHLGDPSVLPIFILGMPRSGSTLVEQILASHPKCYGVGEVDYFHRATGRIVSELNDSTLRLPDVFEALPDKEFQRLGKMYLDRIGAIAPEAARIADKQLSNYFYAGLIHMVFPNARIIHTFRDPVDTCFSCFSTLFTYGQSFTYELRELGRYYRSYRTLMRHWRQVLPERVFLEVRYEDVVADLEQQARRLVAHCDLDWDDACLLFYEKQRPVLTASSVQVRQPIYRTSIDRWRPYQDMLTPLLEELATECENGL